jgi:hypothetical protein
MLATLALGLSLGAAPPEAADWTQWRGPHRDWPAGWADTRQEGAK